MKILLHKRIKSLLFALLQCCILIPLPRTGLTQSEIVFEEYIIKAAFLLRLPEFIYWNRKDINSDFFSICVITPNKNLSSFKQLNGKITKGLPVKVVEVQLSELNPDNCMVIYLGKSLKGIDQNFIDKVSESGCLIVGETSDIVLKGATIGLVVIDNKVKLQVNLQASSVAGLRIDSELLNLSTVLRNGINLNGHNYENLFHYLISKTWFHPTG